MLTNWNEYFVSFICIIMLRYNHIFIPAFPEIDLKTADPESRVESFNPF